LVYLVARLEDPYGLNSDVPELPFGMFVSATIEGHEYDNVVRLPGYALKGVDTILVVDEDNRIDIRKVTVLKTDADYVYVTDGVNQGENICLTALEFVVQGLKVADINKMKSSAGGNQETEDSDLEADDKEGN